MGVDHGVLYLSDGSGVAWDGLVSVTEKEETSSGGSSYYVDGILYILPNPTSDFAATLEALFYPDEFLDYDGFTDIYGEQVRKRFGLSYQTKTESGYKIHIVYNALATPSDRTWNTQADSADLSVFEWDISTIPVAVTEVAQIKPTAHFVIDTSLVDPDLVALIEATLYGSDTAAPQLPDIHSLLAIFTTFAKLIVDDHFDGTWSVTGPDTAITINDDGTFSITYSSVVNNGDGTITISSL